MTPDDRAEYDRRLASVRAGMARNGYDAVVSGDTGDWLPPTGDARYLSGFSIRNMVNVVEGIAVVVPLEGDPILVVPPGPGGGWAAWARAAAWTPLVLSPAGQLVEGVVDALRAAGLERGRVGACAAFQGSGTLAERLPHARVDDASRPGAAHEDGNPFERARMVKSPWEVQRLKGAQRAADVGMTVFMDEVAAGRRHVEAQALGEAAAVAAGAEAAITIMSSGSEPWVWWHYQGDRRFTEGSIVSVEMNARFDGYCAQLARTSVLGIPTGAQAELLAVAEESISAMVAALRPGATGDEVWRAGMAPLRARGVPAWGRLGHGMGLAMDEGVAIVEGDGTLIQPRMTVALHASVWDPRTHESGLLGEQYLVTADGPELLSTTVPHRILALAHSA